MTKKKNKKARVLVLGGGMSRQVGFAGGESVYMSYTDDRAPDALSHENIHGLILTGGVDVDPHLYGQEPRKGTQRPDTKRDRVELRSMLAAFRRGIPILGICRGAQILNVGFKGTLHQEISDAGAHRFHYGRDHHVTIREGSRLHDAMLDATEPWVVSIHHQAVDQVARGFRVSAVSKDGIVEAIESTGERWVLGVQFHPEIATGMAAQGIFDAVVAEAARVAGLPEPELLEPTPKPTPKPKPTIPWTDTSADRWRHDEKPTVQHLPHASRWSHKSGPTITRWQCFRCRGMMFDKRIDHIDHMLFVHGVDLTQDMTDDQVNALINEGLGKKA